jgi:hypothetical protein
MDPEYYCAHNSVPPVHILAKKNAVQTLTPYFPNLRF